MSTRKFGLSMLSIMLCAAIAISADTVEITAVGSSYEKKQLTVAINGQVKGKANAIYYVKITAKNGMNPPVAIDLSHKASTDANGKYEWQYKSNATLLVKNTPYEFKMELYATDDDAINGTNRIDDDTENHTTANGPGVLPPAPKSNEESPPIP